MSAIVYRIYSADCELLYVGTSTQPLQRLQAHSLDKPWWRDVSRIDVEHFDSAAEAASAERRAIQDERPRHNIAGTPGNGSTAAHRRVRRRRAAAAADAFDHLAAERLRFLMSERGWLPRDVEEQSYTTGRPGRHVSYRTVYRVVSEGRKPRTGERFEIAAALGVQPSAIWSSPLPNAQEATA